MKFIIYEIHYLQIMNLHTWLSSLFLKNKLILQSVGRTSLFLNNEFTHSLKFIICKQ